MSPRMLLGATLLVGGAVLALVFPDLRFFWFEGRPLGILLVIIGVFELAETFRRERRSAKRDAGDG